MMRTLFFFPKTTCTTIKDINSPHSKFHRFLLPFSSKFSDLNFTSYVLYIQPRSLGTRLLYIYLYFVTCHTPWAWVTYDFAYSSHPLTFYFHWPLRSAHTKGLVPTTSPCSKSRGDKSYSVNQGRSQGGPGVPVTPPFASLFKPNNLEQVAKMRWRFSLKMSKQTSTLTLTQCDPPVEKSWLCLWCELATSVSKSSRREQTLVPATSPQNSNQFEFWGQVPGTCSSKRFVWTVRGQVPTTSAFLLTLQGAKCRD